MELIEPTIKYPDEKKEWQTESPSKFFAIFVH